MNRKTLHIAGIAYVPIEESQREAAARPPTQRTAAAAMPSAPGEVSSETKIAPDRTVVDFPKTEVASEEKARRVMTEATRLASLAPGEWKLWIDRSAEQLGVLRATLQEIVEALIKDKEHEARKAQVEVRRQEARAEKAQREEERKREREQRRVEKDAERKSKGKHKGFAALIKLPSERHEAKLAALAKQLDEELSTLRDGICRICRGEHRHSPGNGLACGPLARAGCDGGATK